MANTGTTKEKNTATSSCFGVLIGPVWGFFVCAVAHGVLGNAGVTTEARNYSEAPLCNEAFGKADEGVKALMRQPMMRMRVRR